MGFFEALINFFSSLFGGKKETASAQTTTNSTVNEIKTDKQTFYNYMLRGEDYDTIDKLWMEAVSKEQAGIYDYKLTGKLGWYHIQNGQLVGNGTADK